MSNDYQNAPDVAVLVETSSGWGRRLIEGVANYAAKHGPWHLRVEQRGRSEHLNLPPDWRGEGVIARISTRHMHDALKQLGVPVVNVSAIELQACDFPRITSDYHACAHVMAEHFLERGFEHYGYAGPLQYGYVQRLLKEIEAVLKDAGVNSKVSTFNYRVKSVANRGWSLQDKKLKDWLSNQPRPLAAIGWATAAAAHMIDACRSIGLAIPDDVAVLSSDEDELINGSTVPPMSGLAVASGQIGYRAAELLDQLMSGKRSVSTTEMIPPIEIITRASTETFSIDDPELLRAVLYMRQNAFRPLTIEEVADAVPMGRRSLERRYQAWFGHTPLAELSRIRLVRAKQLLSQTDQAISNISLACGFGATSYFSVWFKEATGLSPIKYRSSTQAR
jgi:LacI family transcriptional regulator